MRQQAPAKEVKGMAKPEIMATIKIDASELDRCTEKVNQLIALLETVHKLIDSLSGQG